MLKKITLYIQTNRHLKSSLSKKLGPFMISYGSFSGPKLLWKLYTLETAKTYPYYHFRLNQGNMVWITVMRKEEMLPPNNWITAAFLTLSQVPAQPFLLEKEGLAIVKETNRPFPFFVQSAESPCFLFPSAIVEEAINPSRFCFGSFVIFFTLDLSLMKAAADTLPEDVQKLFGGNYKVPFNN